ncbi:hypothetical protein [Geodermatophilus sp. FMUSA9-8]
MTPDRTAIAAGTRLLCGRPRSCWPRRMHPDAAADALHAVEVHRSAEELTGEPEVALCGVIVAVHDEPWPPDAAERCPECDRLTG